MRTHRRILSIIPGAPGWWHVWATPAGEVERSRVPCLALCETWQSDRLSQLSPPPDAETWHSVVPLISEDDLAGILDDRDDDLGLVHDDEWDATLPHLQEQARAYARRVTR